MRYSIPFFILFLIVLNSGTFAQKVERERRVSSEKFPKASLTFLESEFAGRTHQKLYLETGSSGTTYEAKFRNQQRKYSVKFYENGQWLDTEKEIREDELSPEIKKNMLHKLVSGFNFDAFRMLRIQEQTSVDGIRYEIEIKGKTRNKSELFEFLFDSDGDYLKHEVILIDSYTNEF